MAKIIWSPSALKDIESIARFIERDSIDQASLFVARIIEMTDRLGDFPQSGRVIPEINDDHCREVIYGIQVRRDADCGLRVYDGTTTVTLDCETPASTTSLRIYNNGAVSGIKLVDPADPNASRPSTPLRTSHPHRGS